MGFLDKLQKIYDKLAFQKRYDKIKSWDFSPEVNASLKQLSDLLPNVIVNSLLKWVKDLYADVGKEQTEEKVAELLLKLKNFVV